MGRFARGSAVIPFVAGIAVAGAVALLAGTGAQQGATPREPPLPRFTDKDVQDIMNGRNVMSATNEAAVKEWAGKTLPDGSVVPTIEDVIAAGDAAFERYTNAADSLTAERRLHTCAFANADKVLVITPPGLGFIVSGDGSVVPAGDLSAGPGRYHQYNFRLGTSPQMRTNLIEQEMAAWASRIRAVQASGGAIR